MLVDPGAAVDCPVVLVEFCWIAEFSSVVVVVGDVAVEFGVWVVVVLVVEVSGVVCVLGLVVLCDCDVVGEAVLLVLLVELVVCAMAMPNANVSTTARTNTRVFMS